MAVSPFMEEGVGHGSAMQASAAAVSPEAEVIVSMLVATATAAGLLTGSDVGAAMNPDMRPPGYRAAAARTLEKPSHHHCWSVVEFRGCNNKITPAFSFYFSTPSFSRRNRPIQKVTLVNLMPTFTVAQPLFFG
jgi:hypothetical protein